MWTARVSKVLYLPPSTLGVAVAWRSESPERPSWSAPLWRRTQLDMGIGSAPEGANLGTSAEAPESGNGHTGIKTLYIALYNSKNNCIFLSTAILST